MHQVVTYFTIVCTGDCILIAGRLFSFNYLAMSVENLNDSNGKKKQDQQDCAQLVKFLNDIFALVFQFASKLH